MLYFRTLSLGLGSIHIVPVVFLLYVSGKSFNYFIFFRPNFETEEERLEWEAEQKQIEREWYDNEDNAFDEEYNPFAKVS